MWSRETPCCTPVSCPFLHFYTAKDDYAIGRELRFMNEHFRLNKVLRHRFFKVAVEIPWTGQNPVNPVNPENPV